MDAKLKAKWVKALRSGKYKQAKGRLLGRTGGMCCLGVLCKIQGANLRKFDNLETSDIPEKYNDGLSHSVRSDLARMNDGGILTKRMSFKEIADYIDANL